MIAFLRGELYLATQDTCLIDVMGVGYQLGISAQTAQALPSVGSEVFVHTYLVVREDAQLLYGFATTDERAMFLRLTSVKGVGAKVALSILSSYTPSDLRQIVLMRDVTRMSVPAGVGKKTAERIILELEESLRQSSEFAGGSSATQTRLPVAQAVRAFDEAREALLAMGFTSQEIELALAGCDNDNQSVSQLVQHALTRLGSC